MRLRRRYKHGRRNRLARIEVVACSSVLAIIGGGVVAFDGVYYAPAAVIHRLTIADHRRAEQLAKVVVPPAPAAASQSVKPADGSAPTSSTTTRPPVTPVTPATPAVQGQVATISIPALQITAPVLQETPVNGALIIPADVHNVGWDAQTSLPGDPGVTLLAGHVNWAGQGEGALGEIGQLVPGDTVVLDWQGTTTTWRISTKPVLSPNTIAHPSLFTTNGSPTLALVTCGGPFREVPGVGGSYADNVIVEASLVTS